MVDALLHNNNRKYWAEVSKVWGKSMALPNGVDEAFGKQSIGNLFASKYKSLYNSVSFDIGDMAHLMDEMNEDISHKCAMDKCQSKHNVSVIAIEKAIHHLKMSKADGHTDQCTDHIINGTKKFYVYI